MPLRARLAILTLASAAACSPARFAWDEGGQGTVARYRQAFAAAAGSRFVAAAPRAELLARGATGRVLWLGDQHYSARLHALQFEVLAALRADGLRLALALEAIGEQDQPLVDAYLAGELDEGSLRLRIRRRWPGSWLDDETLDAPHYRALLAFARQHGLPVRALEPTPRLPLAERDDRIAAAVRHLAADHADRLVVVVVGQAHLRGQGDVVARCGLPGLVVGGKPPAALQAAAPPGLQPGWLHGSDGGLWWFSEMLAERP